MKHSTLIGLFALCLAVPAAFAAEPPAAKPDGGKAQAWIVQFPSPAGVMDLHVLVAEGKAVAGFATETDRGPHSDADVTGLTATDTGALAGEVKLTPRPDITAAAGKNVPAAAPTTLTLSVQAKDGRLRGTVTSPTMTQAKPVEAFGRVGDAPATADAQIEVLPLGISSGGQVAKGVPDVHGGDCVVVRCALVAGKVADSAVLLCPISTYPPQTVVAQAIPAGTALVSGHRLAGGMDVTAEGLKGRLTLDGQIIGNQAVGDATWQADGGQAVTTTFRAWVSRMKFRQVSDASDRTWPAAQSLPADPALAAQAAKEALTPIRPGEPGRMPFYSTRAIHLGNYRALYAPTIAFGEVPGAVRYRITAKKGALNRQGGAVEDKKADPGWSFEAEKPWAALTPIWEQVPVGPITVSAVGLDAAGKEVAAAELPETVYHYVGGNPLDDPHWQQGKRAESVKTEGLKYAALRTVPLVKIAPFAGPYWDVRRSPQEAALAAARYGRDAPSRMKVCRGLAGLGNYNTGDGGYAYSIAVFVVECCAVARWTDDPVERADALALAERLGWRLHLGHRGGMPAVYKGVIPGMEIFMQAYRDLHEVTGDERFREALLDLARVLAKAQQPSGGFIHATPRQAWPGGVFGPAEFRENGAEVTLRFFGELRKRLDTSEFAEAEQKARSWTLANALPGMMWQNVGHHSKEMILIQDTVPAFALNYAIWLLDLAEGQQRDVAQAIEVVRWSEERVVDWARQDDPRQVAPFCAGWSRAAGSGTLNMGRLAYCFARLYQETKDPLWKAKAEALVQGILEAQDSVTGFITPFGARNVFGGARIDGRIPSRDMGIAAAALATVPRLLADPTAPR